MEYILIRHKVENFEAWKNVFDACKEQRSRAALSTVYLMREVDDPQAVVMLMETEDLITAMDFIAMRRSPEFGRKAGVVKSQVNFLIREREVEYHRACEPVRTEWEDAPQTEEVQPAIV